MRHRLQGTGQHGAVGGERALLDRPGSFQRGHGLGVLSHVHVAVGDVVERDRHVGMIDPEVLFPDSRGCARTPPAPRRCSLGSRRCGPGGLSPWPFPPGRALGLGRKPRSPARSARRPRRSCSSPGGRRLDSCSTIPRSLGGSPARCRAASSASRVGATSAARALSDSTISAIPTQARAPRRSSFARAATSATRRWVASRAGRSGPSNIACSSSASAWSSG